MRKLEAVRSRRGSLAGLLAGVAACLATFASGAGAVSLDQVGSYASPVFVTSFPDNPDRLLVVEQGGKIQLTTPSGTSQFVNLTSVVRSGGEQGLLSVAFAPDFAASGLIYVYYTGNDGPGNIHVAELRATSDAADAQSRRDVIVIPHADAPNHNGGQLQFGPDGYLYIGTGDGGGGGDPWENGQDRLELLGKLLRIDPRQSGAAPYSIPADNPYFGSTAQRQEIWSYGLRNPYRFSFDRATGALTIGDVGQNEYEEIDYRPAPDAGKGVNFGWDCREGLHPYANTVGCMGVAPTDPVLEYSHSAGGCSVTGGYVVRDPGLSELAGRYVYADFCRGALRSTILDLPSAREDRSEGVQINGPSSFGEDSCGRVYVASLTDGVVSRLVDGTPTDCTAAGGTPPLDPAIRCAEILDGSRRKDALSGGPGGQRIRGRGGKDKLKGGSGDDCLLGGRGDDRLTGGSGSDVLRAGGGADRVNAADGERDVVNCGKGRRDRARVDRRDRVKGCERVRKGRKKRR